MAKKIKLSQMNFFLEKQLIKLSCTYFPLSFCKNLNKFLEPIQNYEDVKNDYEDVQNDTFVLNNFFLVQTIIITFIYLLAFSIVQNFKKFLQRIKSYEDVPFLGPKSSICPKQRFFRKLLKSFSSNYQLFSENLLMSLVSFIYAYLHAKNQSQILIY